MADNNFEHKHNNDEISLKDLIFKTKDIFSYLLKKWRIIVLIGLLGSASGVVISLLEKTEYVASLTFAVQEKSGSGGGLAAALAGQFGVNLGGGTESVFSRNNILELLKSRYLIERALLCEININNKKQRLVDYYIDKNDLVKKWEKKNLPIVSYPLGINRENFSRVQDSLLNVFAKNFVKEDIIVEKLNKETSIIIVRFKGKDELFAQHFIEILVKEVTDFYVQSRVELSTNNLNKMQNSADSVKNEIDNLLLKRAIDADRNLDGVRQILRVPSQKDDINLQLLGTVYSEIIKNIEALKIDIIRETPLIQIIDRPIMPLEKEYLGKVKGIIIGGFLGGFFIIVFLLGKVSYQRIMSEDESHPASAK